MNWLVLVSFVVLLWSGPCFSHHNAASHYSLDKTITVTGVVTEFRLINPHVRIYLDVTSENGNVEKWLAEGNAAGILKRRGWTSKSLKPGDLIHITGRPARDGGNKLDWEIIRLEDGTELRGGNTVGGERERQLDELEERRRRQQQREDAENRQSFRSHHPSSIDNTSKLFFWGGYEDSHELRRFALH